LASTVDESEGTATEDVSGTTYVSGEEDVEEDEDGPSEDSRSVWRLAALTEAIQSALRGLRKKIASLQRELAKAQSLEDTMARANLIVSNLYRLPPGTTSASVEDWENGGEAVELALNTKDYGSAQEEAEALFALARKIKRGSKVVEELMAESSEGEKILQEALLDLGPMANGATALDEGSLMLVQERLERTATKTGFKSPNLDEAGETQQSSRADGNTTLRRRNERRKNAPDPRELTSPSGLKVLVGRNRRDNEALCFQLSRPSDVWMHARGCPGAHVLLRVRRGGPEAADEDLQFAADLAAFYSDARTEAKAAVTTASPKHIAKPRGAPLGAVSLRREGPTLVGRPGDVAHELKEARERSGAAWDETGYRKLGTRTKNKKRTASVEKARKEKQREETRNKNKRRKRKEEQKDFY